MLRQPRLNRVALWRYACALLVFALSANAEEAERLFAVSHYESYLKGFEQRASAISPTLPPETLKELESSFLEARAALLEDQARADAKYADHKQFEVQQETLESFKKFLVKLTAAEKTAAVVPLPKPGSSGPGAEAAKTESENPPAVTPQPAPPNTPTADELNKRLNGSNGLRSRLQRAKLALEEKAEKTSDAGSTKSLITAAENAVRVLEGRVSQDLRASPTVKKNTRLNQDQADALAELEKAVQAMEAVINPGDKSDKNTANQNGPQPQPPSKPAPNSPDEVLASLKQRMEAQLQFQHRAEAKLNEPMEMDPDHARLQGMLKETVAATKTAYTAIDLLEEALKANPHADTSWLEKDAVGKLNLAVKSSYALQDALTPTVGRMLSRLNCAGRSGEGLSYRLKQATDKLKAANLWLKTLGKTDPRLESYKKIAQPLPNQLAEAQQAVKSLCGSLNPQDSSKTASPAQQDAYGQAESLLDQMEDSLGKLPFDKEPKEKPEKGWITLIAIFIVLAGIFGAIFMPSPWRKGKQSDGAIPRPAGNSRPTGPDTAEPSRHARVRRYPDRNVKPSWMQNTEPDISEVQLKALQHELAKTQQELRDKTIENTQLKTAITKASQIGRQLQASIQAKNIRIEQLENPLAGQRESSGWSQDSKPPIPTEPVIDSKENPQAQALESTAMLVIEEINKPEAKEMNAEALGNTIRQRMQNARLPARFLYFLDLFLDKEAEETWGYVLVACKPGELSGEANALLFVRPGFKYSSTSSQYFDGGSAGEEMKEMLEPAQVQTGPDRLPLRPVQRGKVTPGVTRLKLIQPQDLPKQQDNPKAPVLQNAALPVEQSQDTAVNKDQTLEKQLQDALAKLAQTRDALAREKQRNHALMKHVEDSLCLQSQAHETLDALKSEYHRLSATSGAPSPEAEISRHDEQPGNEADAQDAWREAVAAELMDFIHEEKNLDRDIEAIGQALMARLVDHFGEVPGHCQFYEYDFSKRVYKGPWAYLLFAYCPPSAVLLSSLPSHGLLLAKPGTKNTLTLGTYFRGAMGSGKVEVNIRPAHVSLSYGGLPLAVIKPGEVKTD